MTIHSTVSNASQVDHFSNFQFIVLVQSKKRVSSITDSEMNKGEITVEKISGVMSILVNFLSLIDITS